MLTTARHFGRHEGCSGAMQWVVWAVQQQSSNHACQANIDTHTDLTTTWQTHLEPCFGGRAGLPVGSGHMRWDGATIRLTSNRMEYRSRAEGWVPC